MPFAMNNPHRSAVVRLTSAALLSVILVVWMLLPAAESSPAGPGPASQVQLILARLAEIVEAGKASNEREIDERLSRARDSLEADLAIEAVAGHILGNKIWPGLTEKERLEFIVQLGALLQPAIAAKLAYYGGGEMQVVEERISGEKALVKTRFTVGGKVSSLVFSMLHSTDQWQLFDINIDGVSLVRNLMAQIRPIAGRSGIAGVLAELQRQAAENRAKAAAAQENSRFDR
jgi:phospholipid transport system substrate-binding protein